MTNIDDIEPFEDNRNKNISQYYCTMENKKTKKDKVQSTNGGLKWNQKLKQLQRKHLNNVINGKIQHQTEKFEGKKVHQYEKVPKIQGTDEQIEITLQLTMP